MHARAPFFLAALTCAFGCGGEGDAKETPRWFEAVDAFDQGAFGETGPVDIAGTPFEAASWIRRVGGGVCPIDVDGAPPLDLYFALPSDGAGIRPRLMVGEAAFQYTDQTEAYGLDAVDDAIGCLAFDADGDGDDDLIVTQVGAVHLFLREGAGFTDASATLDLDVPSTALMTAAAAADLDGDGDLDLVVAGYFLIDPDVDASANLERNASATGVRNYLLVRQEDGSYNESGTSLAPSFKEREPTFLVQPFDATGDGVPEIFVGNDLAPAFKSRMLERDGDGVFQDVSSSLGFLYDSHGTGIDAMGWTQGDLDRDGKPEYAVSNYADKPTVILARENDGFYADHGESWGTAASSENVRWGIGLADFDLDGWVDLVEAQGHLYTDDELDKLGTPDLYLASKTSSYRNVDGTRLEWLTPPEGDGRDERIVGRGLAVVDLDDDGRLDVVIGTAVGRPLMLKNVAETKGHWLRLVLEGNAPNTGAIGARVTLTSQRGTLVRERVSAEGYLGNFDPRLHFGLEQDPGSVTVEVRWPNGKKTVLEDLVLDTELVVEEPD